jgi:hypothetical protein
MAELPKTYKACVYDEPGKISTKVVNLDVPEPGPGEVLVKLSVSCGRKGLYPPILADLTAAHTQAYAILTSASWLTAGRLFLCQLSPAKLEATKASAGSLSLVQASSLVPSSLAIGLVSSGSVAFAAPAQPVSVDTTGYASTRGSAATTRLAHSSSTLSAQRAT